MWDQGHLGMSDCAFAFSTDRRSATACLLLNERDEVICDLALYISYERDLHQKTIRFDLLVRPRWLGPKIISCDRGHSGNIAHSILACTSWPFCFEAVKRCAFRVGTEKDETEGYSSDGYLRLSSELSGLRAFCSGGHSTVYVSFIIVLRMYN